MKLTNRPNISQYMDTVSNPFGLTRSLGEFEVERDIYQQPRIRVGNNAVVFKIRPDTKELMLKCYIKDGPHRREIYDYVSSLKDPLLSDIRLLKQELYVYDAVNNGTYYDVVVSNWEQGQTLEAEIGLAVREGDRERLLSLSKAFDHLAVELLSREWAHGDINPNNIIVSPSGELRLIDYDAMFIPTLAGATTQEVGTAAYQHPLRNEHFYSKHIDDYSIALICSSLYAIALEPSLYELYNTTDNIILQPVEVIAGNSEGYKKMMSLFTKRAEHQRFHLARMLLSRSPKIAHLKRAVTNCMSTPEESRSKVTVEGWTRDCDKSELLLVEREGLWGYTDKEGVIVIEPMYDRAMNFSEGLAVVEMGNQPSVINTQGTVIINDLRFTLIKPFSDGLAAVKIDGLWGYINSKGAVVINPNYIHARSMREGGAAVMMSEEGKWGYIDTNGESIVEPKFDYAFSFKDGNAVAYIGEKMFHLDHNGEINEVKQ